MIAVHDPVELPMQNKRRHIHLRPRLGQIQLLQLLIEGDRTAVEMIRVVAWPELGSGFALLEELRGLDPADEQIVIERRQLFHAAVHFRRCLAVEREAIALDLKHVLEPALAPAADGYKAAHTRQVFRRRRNERSKPAAVTHADDEDAIRVDEIVTRKSRKRGAIIRQLSV